MNALQDSKTTCETPKFNPKSPDALVMPRPNSDHQVMLIIYFFYQFNIEQIFKICILFLL